MRLSHLRFGAHSVAGRRPRNEDAVLAAPPVFAVADGMGGHAHGQAAAAAVVSALATLAGRGKGAHQVTSEPPHLTARDVAASLHAAGEAVRGLAAPTGAGSTVTGACLTSQHDQPYWLVLNVGDSRTYRLAEGHLEQISVDHSESQELIEAGRLRPADAGRYRRRHVITRAIGSAAAEVDFWLLPVGAQDRLLLCSDGLTAELPDAALARALQEILDPQRAAEQLVSLALTAGSRDNVTAVVVDAGAGGDGEDTLPRGPAHPVRHDGGSADGWEEQE